MEWKAIYELIDKELFAVVAACWVLGYMLKRTPRIPSWTIVYIVTIAAIALVTAIQGMSAQSVISGLLCGAFSVYGHQIVKQAWEGANKDEDHS